MVRFLLGFIILGAFSAVSSGQVISDSLTSVCIEGAGPDAKFLKDFRVQLGEGNTDGEFRYMTTMVLRARTTYRFSMCTEKSSRGHLIVEIRNDQDRKVASSYDNETGGVYPYIDFRCRKNGVYKIFYDFSEHRSGSGVSVVSMIE